MTTNLRALLLALLPAALAACSHGAAPAPDASASRDIANVPEPFVATLAGNGRMRADDGDYPAAAFLFPYGVAVAPDGTIYVSDAGAQAIRRLKNGKVTFVAGNAPLGVTEQARHGGYLDGPAMGASFIWPTGLALAKDGSLFIADTGNHCIRKLQNGYVTTFAGSDTPGSRDGDRGDASFLSPQGLAFDADGNLYVADFGNGVRRITPKGAVSTLKFLPARRGRVLAIDVKGAGRGLTIAYTEDGALHLWSANGGLQTIAAGDPIEPVEDGLNAAGSFYGVALLGPHAVAVTDVLHDVVRFVRFKDGPYSNYITSRIIAGRSREGDGAVGGFADGFTPASRVNIPLGIARMADGTLIFTDAGNRRVRTIAGVDPRGPVGPDLAGLSGPKDTYRVAVVGDSFDFWGVLWPESIAGRIEAGLKAARSTVGRAPYVSTVRLDGTSISQQLSFVHENLGDGQTDLVVLLIDDITLTHEWGASGGGDWQKVAAQRLRVLQSDLAKRGTRLLVVLIPPARAVSLNEVPEIGAFNDGQVTALAFEQDNDRAHQVVKQFSAIGVPVFALQQPMEEFEASASRVPLYNMRDIHLSPQGATFVGDAVAGEILRRRLWTASGGASGS
jgi:sugar lactone lactonase YvrE